ncbi:MAG: hypothetical protein MUW56_15075 [Chryseobacterium sp.]|uniref:hypothetical protein n=1 Tax=Chryseobacterium sp. TaxID=1871047 RepID=UPI0025C4DAB1|nr:hypothetical protein [Chryseobacterium sp.]MCJ7934899.1 hypothetical protein [Chryseobacterium sp.]
MELKSGIKIFCTDVEFEEAVTINTGSHSSKDHPSAKFVWDHVECEPQYEPQSYLPKKDWKKVSGSALSKIKTDHFRKDYNTIVVGKISEEMKGLFQQLHLHTATNEKETLACFYNNKEIVEQLNENLHTFLNGLSQSGYSFLCVGAGYPNCETTSFDRRGMPEEFAPDKVRFIGLHKDSSNRQMTVGSSHKHGNRLSINLGQESRYFLFINLSILQIYNMLKKKMDVKKENVNNTNIVRFFLTYFPDYPVLRIKQKPYEFYIAPTDNCIHDGSTLGTTTVDITMIFLGHFEMK